MSMPLPLEEYEKINPVATVDWSGEQIHYVVPNRTTLWRVETLMTKEADTIEWIAGFAPDELLVDIGANVGMYSVWAARTRGTQVFAFEPEAQNYALLNRNIRQNGLSERVTAFCVALSETSGFDRLFLGNFIPGESNHTYGESLDCHLQPRQSAHIQGSVAVTLDELVEAGVVPVPQHIKVDVDGIEHKVIAGARRTLARPEVKSVMIELNHNVTEHESVITTLAANGFHFSELQVALSLQKEGPFANIGNALFMRSADALEAIAQRFAQRLAPQAAQPQPTPAHAARPAWAEAAASTLEACAVDAEPSPHFFARDLFPAELYARIQTHLPSDSEFQPITETGMVQGKGAYARRSVVQFTPEGLQRLGEDKRAFWREIGDWLASNDFARLFLMKFAQPWLAERFGELDLSRVSREVLLLRDRRGYSLGPHTDSPDRLGSLLIYLPADERLADLGTSFYRPKEAGFRCAGGPHYAFEDFERAATLPFVPNAALGFLKTDRAFHGVEPVATEDIRRDILGLTLRLR